MATYVTKKCPHCGFAYQVFQSGEQREYGCPYITCERCFKHYWDTDIVEPALHGYKNFYEIKQSLYRIITIILFTPMALLMLGFGMWLLMNKIMIGFFALAMGIGTMWIIVSHIKQKIDDKRYRDDIIESQQIDYDESMKRLKDTDYLTALAKFDKKAKKLLNERMNGYEEHYANRPR